MKSLSDVITPACIINQEKLKKNARRFFDIGERQQVALRPHVKTLKSVEAASIYAPLPMPITVSTLAEAKYFAEAGYTDILYAVTLTPNKVPTVDALLQKGVKLTVVVDSLAAIKALSSSSQQIKHTMPVAIEIDSDGHRAGVKPDSPELVDIANEIAASQYLHFEGLVTHAGASYGAFTTAQQCQIARAECEAVTFAAERLQDQGIKCAMVSVGSTPTVFAPICPVGITELRAGVYATFDCVMAGLNLCTYDDIAMSVLTTVIGFHCDGKGLLVDAGWMALSRDTGTHDHPHDCGYGLVCDSHGALMPGWVVESTNQEHGIIRHKEGIDPQRVFQFGDIIRILPIHACSTGAQYAHYYVTSDDHTIEATWQRVNGW
ncbi:alanine racemase [Alteromonas ponticola]|uniref:Alanine racemase n=1 Tax=Alteromonas aquimaris TaxID=2998417 RepID=A0ABT3P6L5_9ALTE|nr:alanine racemase [Alteromonas aquimaris]MCW8108364.1 alanine racemase [Alteromonas aquimaris]